MAVYLPIQKDGKQILVNLSDNTWRVSTSSGRGVAYRKAKDLEDRAGGKVKDGEVIAAVDEGDGWVRVDDAEATSAMPNESPTSLPSPRRVLAWGGEDEAGPKGRSSQQSTPRMEDVNEEQAAEIQTAQSRRVQPGANWETDSDTDDGEVLVVPTVLPDRTILFEDAEGSADVESPATQSQPVLSLVSLNTRTATSVDILRGTLSVLPDLPDRPANVRTVRISCGRGPGNTIVLKDSRVSLHHFTVRVRAAAGGRVVLDLLDQSSNGTWVDGKRVGRGRRVTLSIGSRIVALPSKIVGKDGEVGYVLLQDTKGARCNAVQQNSSDAAQGVASTESPKRLKGVPRALEEDLRCGICTDVLHRCLTVVPCGHNFCAYCLAKWRRRSATCPGCREPVRQAVQNLDMDRVVDTFLRAHPEAARSSEEVDALERSVCEPESAAHLRSLLRDRIDYTTHAPLPVASPQRHNVRQQRPHSGHQVRQSPGEPRAAHQQARRQEEQPQSAACVIC